MPTIKHRLVCTIVLVILGAINLTLAPEGIYHPLGIIFLIAQILLIIDILIWPPEWVCIGYAGIYYFAGLVLAFGMFRFAGVVMLGSIGFAAIYFNLVAQRSRDPLAQRDV